MKNIARAAALLSAAIFFSNADAVPSYEIQGLGALNPSFFSSSAEAINNLGQVVGSSVGLNFFSQAYFWDPVTGMEAIGTLPESESSSAFGVNDNGEVVGFSPVSMLPAPPGQADHFIWDRTNGIRTLGATHPQDSFGIASDINNNSQVAGTALYPHPTDPNIFLNATPSMWDPINGNQDLGSLSADPIYGGGSAAAINEAGFIVGDVFDALRSTSGQRGVVEAFIWDEATGITALNHLNPAHAISAAIEINNNNDVVGFSEIDINVIRAVLWESANGDPIELGLLDPSDGTSFARSINDDGLIVGDIVNSTIFPGFGPNPLATIWEDNVAYYLGNLLVNPDGWLGLLAANDINELGQIVGTGVRGDPLLGNFTFEAFILTPVTSSANVLEPSTLGLIGIAFCLSLYGQCTRRKIGVSKNC